MGLWNDSLLFYMNSSFMQSPGSGSINVMTLVVIVLITGLCNGGKGWFGGAGVEIFK